MHLTGEARKAIASELVQEKTEAKSLLAEEEQFGDTDIRLSYFYYDSYY